MKDDLTSQRNNLCQELANLKGLFSGRRRKEIEMQLAQIDQQLNSL